MSATLFVAPVGPAGIADSPGAEGEGGSGDVVDTPVVGVALSCSGMSQFTTISISPMKAAKILNARLLISSSPACDLNHHRRPDGAIEARRRPDDQLFNARLKGRQNFDSSFGDQRHVAMPQPAIIIDINRRFEPEDHSRLQDIVG